MKAKYIFLTMFLAAFFFGLPSCKTKNEKKKKINRQELKESLIKANAKLVKSEADAINGYIDRTGLEMQKTGSGMYFAILDHGTGPMAEEGKTATLSYSIQFLSGDTLENGKEHPHLEFVIGKGLVIAGLNEAIRLLREGDEAKLIIPSHMAYGLTGKPGKIPPKASLIYNVKVLKIK
jgi:FKBP-type peptidyl-prolyl cis-trans isomerase